MLHRISSIRRVWLAIGLVVALSAAFAAIAMSDTIVTSTTKDALTENATGLNLSTTGGTPVTITSMTLPSGAWVVSADPTVVNFGPSDYFRCLITENGVQVAGGATMVGNPNLPGNQGPGVYVAGRPLIGGFKTSTSVTLALVCAHDHNTPSGEPPPYVDRGAVLLAHRSASNIAGVPTF
jgi:hypothetical protein